jgi:hypothetical protein
MVLSQNHGEGIYTLTVWCSEWNADQWARAFLRAAKVTHSYLSRVLAVRLKGITVGNLSEFADIIRKMQIELQSETFHYQRFDVSSPGEKVRISYRATSRRSADYAEVILEESKDESDSSTLVINCTREKDLKPRKSAILRQ